MWLGYHRIKKFNHETIINKKKEEKEYNKKTNKIIFSEVIT